MRNFGDFLLNAYAKKKAFLKFSPVIQVVFSVWHQRVCFDVAADFGSGVFLASPGGGCLWGVVNQGVACPDNKYTVVTRIEPFKEFIGAMPPKYGNCNLTDLECWGYIKNQTPHSDLYEEETTAAAVFVWDAMDLDTFAACLFLSIVFIRWH